MMEAVTAEISGPVLASFHHRFGESPADFLAILLGGASVLSYSENSDLATQTEKSKMRFVVEDWIIVSTEEVMNFQSGKLKKESLQSIVKGKTGVKFIGILKFKKTSTTELSYLDRRLMDAVLESCSWSEPKPHLYISVGEEVTSTLSIKYNMSTFLLEHKKSCFRGPWSGKIPLVVPNLGTDQRVEYMQGGGGGSKALGELVLGSDLEKSCYIDVNKNFLPLVSSCKAGMKHYSDRVAKLDESKAALEEQVIVLRRKLEEKLELSKEMKVVRGLQGDLKAALEMISFGGNEMDNSEHESQDMFNESQPVNGIKEMETNESDQSDILGLLDQSL